MAGLNGHSGTVPAPGRVAWVDIAKGICIILVVMMHSTLGLEYAVGREGFMNTIVVFARPFRMPDFFLLSGLFLARVIDRDWRSYGDKRVLHFVYFYVLWYIIQFGMKGWGMAEGNPVEFARLFLLGFIEPLGTLWFVYLLAVLSVVTKLLKGVPGILLVAVAAALEIAPVATGWTVIDEFCERWVYFLVGYLCAPMIFRFAAQVPKHRLTAIGGLAVWALVNGFFAFSASPVEGLPTFASLPVLSLILGIAGSAAIITVASLLVSVGKGEALRYCGENSIVIYLAFFLPMAVTRVLLMKSGALDAIGVGWGAFLVTAAAVVTPLIVARIISGTWLNFLFVRPAAFRLGPKPVLSPAE
ncbi:acyltransferase family protein [Chelatococcus sp.]|uniref:acyltransferase family protein n=1 Tax=Chelatococcus sp. TaxID=1953771 RepID=UPI0025C30B97|nr:acyltransferase family protein [Chelatococcus sp.]